LKVFNIEHVRPLYASKGYLRAKIGPPQPHLAGNPDNSAGSNIETLIPSRLPAVFMERCVMEGNTGILSSGLDGVVGLKVGEIADGTKIEELWRILNRNTGNAGISTQSWTRSRNLTTPPIAFRTASTSWKAPISHG